MILSEAEGAELFHGGGVVGALGDGRLEIGGGLLGLVLVDLGDALPEIGVGAVGIVGERAGGDLHEEVVVAELVGDVGETARSVDVGGLEVGGGLEVLLGVVEITLGAARPGRARA